jgi:hypothetical protein
MQRARRFGGRAVNHNRARLAQLLRQASTLAKAARFEEQIQPHEKALTSDK